MSSLERRLKAAHELIFELMGRITSVESIVTYKDRRAHEHYNEVFRRLGELEAANPLLAGIANANSGERTWLKLIKHSEMTR